jgi:hypothetical protein
MATSASNDKAPTATPASKAIKPDAMISVIKRNRDLEKRAHRTTLAVCAVSCALAVSVLGNIYLGQKTPEPVYFVQNSDGTGLAKIVPLNKPNTSISAVTQLVADGVSCVNGLDFANYKDQLNACSKYFTKTGWGRFLQEFEASGTKAAIEKQSLVLSVVTKVPRIVSEGEILGALYWDGETSYTVRYQGSGYDNSQSATAVLKVVRVPLTENPRGIAIAQFRGAAG